MAIRRLNARARSGSIFRWGSGCAGPAAIRATSPLHSFGSKNNSSTISQRGCDCIGAIALERRAHGRNASASWQSRTNLRCAGQNVRSCCLGVTIGLARRRSGDINLSVQDASLDRRFDCTGFSDGTRYLRLRDVGLVLRNRDSSQDTDDRHNDHQLDQGETLLHIACDRTTVHSLTPGWFVEPGNQPGAMYLPQHLCHPVSPPQSDQKRHLCLHWHYTT